MNNIDEYINLEQENSDILLKSGTELINSGWFFGVLKDVDFFNDDNPYPKTQYGLISFLEMKNIKIVHYRTDSGWMYVGIDTSEDNDFTQDYNRYDLFDECVDTSIVECMCYLANNIKNNNK